MARSSKTYVAPLVLAVLAATLIPASRPAGIGIAEAQSQDALQIAAASDLRQALGEIAALFESQRHVRVRLTFGSSGLLASQIEQGAPFDLFFSANESFVRTLASKGLVSPDTVQLYAIGRIVLWTRSDSPVDVSGGLRVLLDERIRFVAIANPKHAPYGQAAMEALRTMGIQAQVQPKLVLGENISQTLQLVQTGNADAGIVALSLAIGPNIRHSGRHWLIPPYLHRPIRQALGVVIRSPHQETARAFVAFLNSPSGRAIMRRYGFALPGETV